jgi:hypothetical protein
MPSKKRLKGTEIVNMLSTNEVEVSFTIEEPLMGKAAIDAWQSDKEIAPVSELDDIFNKRIAEIEAETASNQGRTEIGEVVREVADLFEPISDMDEQIHAICETVADIKATLIGKNQSYGGSAFKDVVLGGRLITAEDAILVRIADKIRRLTEGEEYGSEDSFQDLLGYLVLRMAVKKFKEKK